LNRSLKGLLVRNRSINSRKNQTAPAKIAKRCNKSFQESKGAFPCMISKNGYAR